MVDFRSLIEREPFTPYVIRTKSGRTYMVRDPANVWIFPMYPQTVVVAAPGAGLVLLDIAAIESVQIEHEPVTVPS
jgi:hypothetical protein